MSYIGYTPSFQVNTSNQLSDQVIAIVSTQTQYTLSFAPTSDNLLIVSVNGTFYVPTIDFYIEGNIITFINSSFPSSGNIYIYYLGSNYFRLNSVTDASIQVNHLSSQLKLFQLQLFTGDGVETVFQLEFTPGSSYSVLIFIDDVLQKPAVDYTIVDRTLTFVNPPSLSSEITIRNLGFKGTEEVYIIPDEAVVEDKLASNAVTTSKILDGSVTTTKLNDNSVTFAKLNSSLISNIFFYEVVSSDLVIDNTRSRKLLVDTSLNSVSITLPATPVIGQLVEILDANNSFDEYICTIIRNGKKINNDALNVSFYKQGIYCKLIYIGNDNWKLIYYDEGSEFIGLQNMIRCAIEGRTVDNEGDLFFSYFDVKGNYPWIYTVASLPASVNSYETVSLTYMFKPDSVTFSDLGSSILPTITAIISDGLTPVTFTLNTATSTTHSLVFDCIVPSGITSSFFTLDLYDAGSYTVQVNGLDFSIVPVDQNITFVMTVRFIRETTVAKNHCVYSIVPSSASLTTGQTLTLSINSTANFVRSGTGTLSTLSFLLSDGLTTKLATLNTATSTTSSLKFDYVVEAATLTTGITVKTLTPEGYSFTFDGRPFVLDYSIPLAVNFT